MTTNSYTYRKLYEEYHGSIPKDVDGRTYEIHHVDGNRNNNDITNLVALSIKEHYDIHYKQGDYGACVMIAKRMNLPTDHLSEIQKGCKRPGIGGVKKGTIPWNKNKSGYKVKLTEDGRQKKIHATKKYAKISDEESKKIRTDYDNKITIESDLLGKTMGNGKIMSYERIFSRTYAEKYGVTEQYIFQIIKRISKIV